MLFVEARQKFLVGLVAQDKSQETINGYDKDLGMVQRFLESKYNCQIYLEDIKTQDIEDYLLMLKEEKGYQPASRNRHLNTLRSFYKYATKKGWVKDNPTLPLEQVKVPRKERQYLTEEEFFQLLEVIDHQLIQLVVRFLYFTGLRISECLNLTIDDVNLEEGWIHVRQGKGNKERFVPISSKLKPYLEDYKENWRVETDSNIFFATKKTGRLSDVYVNRVLAEATAKLGWKKKVTCHILRHSFASQLVKKNVNPVNIQKLLGHADLKTTSVYVHANQEQLAEAVNVL
ncbi:MULTISPECIES: tyrosine-type recombinase/integrase [unclassified Geobacillus]|uniref:tyrosine-type recombinase/integrase n=1 Tax=Geobacillus TaxID=129337 RepID=UPI000D362CA0|nr:MULTISPECIES: tyrosine-type recombinase/integrase [unclassified Geobacillus]PUF87831.1 recombinase [Geobacillus sp. LYN3]RDV22519.1 recombinase [Parageobacillus toebii]TXK88701.1 tyrosine-type recombinase/integrase [Geobacillus sp. AYS3]